MVSQLSRMSRGLQVSKETNSTTLTKDCSNFAEWHQALEAVACSQHGSAADAVAWHEDYMSGKTPRQAWEDEWGWEDGVSEEN